MVELLWFCLFYFFLFFFWRLCLQFCKWCLVISCVVGPCLVWLCISSFILLSLAKVCQASLPCSWFILDFLTFLFQTLAVCKITNSSPLYPRRNSVFAERQKVLQHYLNSQSIADISSLGYQLKPCTWLNRMTEWWKTDTWEQTRLLHQSWLVNSVNRDRAELCVCVCVWESLSLCLPFYCHYFCQWPHSLQFVKRLKHLLYLIIYLSLQKSITSALVGMQDAD